MLPILTAAAGAPAGPPAWVQFFPFIAMAGVLWFFLIRPQMRQQKDLRTKIGGIKKGDQVLTGGGLVGKVIKVDETYAELELAPNVRVRALRSTIADVIPPPGSNPAND
ncbi:MAG: preprotein translocase subunit YajC [Novosphingobium sp.]|nr:preprotein translocase subunit YajC [Novosphingobium sp.]